MRESRRALLATFVLLLITAIWGTTFFLIKDLLDRVPTLDFLAVRFAIARRADADHRAARRSARLTATPAGTRSCSALLYGVAQILQTAGLAHTAASVSGFITGMYVVATPLFAALLLKTRITAHDLGRGALATAGLAVLTLERPLGRVRRGAHAGRRDALRAAHRRPRRVVDGRRRRSACRSSRSS